ncbi:GAF domain-containing protein [Longimicrobium sp.]|uniref:GAF domain-containing protein n=1 Tax=Longimicrobium sp. TaxID=2029185 RepID=UPI002B956E39|nr:GAF domain-containing protein [Longimicrobium sp.]HSU13882.1 GAF domain-containing protein [Longimicrobium sp.]
MTGRTQVAAGDAALAEAGRLQEIVDLDLLTPEVDAILQQTAEEAAARLGLPMSMVTVVLDEAQFFAAHHGLTGWMAESRGTPVEWSFCANAVASREPFVVEDATTHPTVRDNPLVANDGIRCYAGIPLVSTRGHALGTLCVIGTEARTFSDADLDVLRGLAHRAVDRIEARRTTESA